MGGSGGVGAQGATARQGECVGGKSEGKGNRKTLKEMLAESKPVKEGGVEPQGKVKDLNTVVVESDEDDSDEGAVDSGLPDDDDADEERAEAAAAAGGGVAEISALLERGKHEEEEVVSAAAGVGGASQAGLKIATNSPKAVGTAGGDMCPPSALLAASPRLNPEGEAAGGSPENVGLGLTFRKSDGLGGLVVKRVKPDSAAAQHSGVLQPGVRILSIDQSSLDDISSARQLAALTHGTPGSVCEVEVEMPDGSKQMLALTRPLCQQ